MVTIQRPIQPVRQGNYKQKEKDSLSTWRKTGDKQTQVTESKGVEEEKTEKKREGEKPKIAETKTLNKIKHEVCTPKCSSNNIEVKTSFLTPWKGKKY